MTKFTVDMSYTVTYCHTVEIDAASEQEAKKKARDVFDAADIEKYWGREDDDRLEMEVWELEDEK